MSIRSWCFTENNPKGLIDWETIDEKKKIRYAVYQEEVGEEGTPHLQGYVEFNCTVRLAYCRTLLPTAHWSSRRGTRDEARNYCMKDDTRVTGPYEYGTWSKGGQGKRNDWDKLKEMVKKGTDMIQIHEECSQLATQYTNNIQKLIALHQPKRTWQTEVHVLYGPTNTGKTRYVMDKYPDTCMKQDSKWWDNYHGQETLLLDDFYGWIKYHELLRLCDRYEYMIEGKGTQAQFLAKRIFITSNTHPSMWYTNSKITGTWDSFVRRVTSWAWCPEYGRHLVFTDYKDFCKVAPYCLNACT